MAEYVSREKMMALFNKYHPRMATSVVDYWIELGKLPTEHVVDDGKWLKSSDNTYCSLCGWTKHEADIRRYNFCPNCGATMGL